MNRPAKHVLLVGSDEQRMSELRFMLRTHSFRVTTAEEAAAAEQLIVGTTEFVDVLLVLWPIKDALQLLRRAKAIDASIATLVVAEHEASLVLGWAPDATLCSGRCHSSDILERIKQLSARKRGPRPVPKPESGV